MSELEQRIQQLLAIAPYSLPPSLPVGNLTGRRPIIEVRDMARVLWLAVERGDAGEVYNTRANAIYSVEELIQAIQSFAKVSIPALHRGLEIGLARTWLDIAAWWRERLANARHPKRLRRPALLRVSEKYQGASIQHAYRRRGCNLFKSLLCGTSRWVSSFRSRSRSARPIILAG
jgi:nucleoside-diphosphate-sugar epimerase